MRSEEIKPISPDEARRLMKQAVEEDIVDPEVAHHKADIALCGLLVYHGYRDIVEDFFGLVRWYA